MKSRENRRSVMISARLRAGGGWSDARILNISSRGLMVHADQAPSRGAYVEIRKGSHHIVARVVWAEAQRFGVYTQDRLPVDSIANGIEPAAPTAEVAGKAERRSRPRPPTSAERHEASRRRARMAEYLCAAGFGIAAAALAFGAIESMLARPLAMVADGLGGKG